MRGGREEAAAGRLQRHAVADAGQHVPQLAPRGIVHDDVVGGDERQAEALGELAPLGKGGAHRAAVAHARTEPDVAGQGGGEFVQPFALLGGRARRRPKVEITVGPAAFCGLLGLEARSGQHDQLLVPRMFEEVGKGEEAAALGRANVAARQHAAQPTVGGAVAGIGEDVGRAVAEYEAYAAHHAKVLRLIPVVAQEQVRPHDAGERVAVGDADPGETEHDRLGDELLRVRGAAQEGEVGRYAELGEALGLGETNHANSPCMNQRGACASP